MPVDYITHQLFLIFHVLLVTINQYSYIPARLLSKFNINLAEDMFSLVEWNNLFYNRPRINNFWTIFKKTYLDVINVIVSFSLRSIHRKLIFRVYEEQF